MQDSELLITADGRIGFVYDDALRPFLELGAAAIARASHVEPTSAGEWTADLTPAGGPVLGPFMSREKALLAERLWLSVKDLGSFLE